MTDLAIRARLALAVSSREVADGARAVLGEVSRTLPRGELVARARAARRESLAMVDRAVLAELADGATWAEVAEMTGHACAEDALEAYGETWEAWQSCAHDVDPHTGRPGGDVTDTARALDQWWGRHAEPWETSEGSPVTDLLCT